MLVDVVAVTLLFLAALFNHETLACPPVCMCLDVSNNVHCSNEQLPFIPEGIPSDVRELYLHQNKFENTELVRSNFSTFKFVTNLYLNDCGIEKIRPDTFADLRYLRLLSLKDNRIKIIEDYTFKGLVLNHLFLGSNPGLLLSNLAFYGLSVEGLHLQNCEIRHIHHEVIEPVKKSLKLLILDNNLIERFTRPWERILRTLNHVRLSNNPFHCNCELSWLHKLYVDKNASISAASDQPSCSTPVRLRKKNFRDLLEDDFICDLPIFSSVDVDLGLDSGKLFCEARGDPTPTIVWLSPSGEAIVFPAPLDETIKENRGLLHIQKSAGKTREVYACIARNPGGNVTVNVTVTWPPITVVEAAPIPSTTVTSPKPNTTKIPQTTATVKTTTLKQQGDKSPDKNKSVPIFVVTRQGPYDTPMRPYDVEAAQIRDKSPRDTAVIIGTNTQNTKDDAYYTLVQLVSSIVGTFTLTLLMCVVVFHLYYRRQRRLLFAEQQHQREKTPDNVYVTSDIDEQTLKMMNQHNQHNQMREQTG